ncbi:MAG: hypothetical protein L0Y71_05700 [Gemmataceae bacterium]|nr:hypothetical protein [Gemmataceae bacterium]
MPVVVVQPRIIPRIFATVRIIVWVIALGLIVLDYSTAMRLATNNVQYIQFIGNIIFFYCCARAFDFILRYADEAL